ncbi:PDZ and LIM domain protein 7-like [Corticium candelabrum]|uniref:PDZ and LIM domain protein 7-like n=1 Tax=Corticium candelabrum TaxID=121492 RepID=UPI002E26D4B1|nr:PDZ and LIM domain protein 7-like [Corticium candelabrum]
MAETESFTIVIEGGAPWGFRLQGGREFRSPLRIAGLTPGGKASKSGLLVGDYIRSVNSIECDGLRHNEAQKLVKSAGRVLNISISRGSGPPPSPREPLTPMRTTTFPIPLPVHSVEVNFNSLL